MVGAAFAWAAAAAFFALVAALTLTFGLALAGFLSVILAMGLSLLNFAVGWSRRSRSDAQLSQPGERSPCCDLSRKTAPPQKPVFSEETGWERQSSERNIVVSALGFRGGSAGGRVAGGGVAAARGAVARPPRLHRRSGRAAGGCLTRGGCGV